MNSSPLAAIWHWYPLLAWVACARFCSLPLGSLSYLNFYLKLRLDSNFSYGTGLGVVELYLSDGPVIHSLSNGDDGGIRNQSSCGEHVWSGDGGQHAAIHRSACVHLAAPDQA